MGSNGDERTVFDGGVNAGEGKNCAPGDARGKCQEGIVLISLSAILMARVIIVYCIFSQVTQRRFR